MDYEDRNRKPGCCTSDPRGFCDRHEVFEFEPSRGDVPLVVEHEHEPRTRTGRYYSVSRDDLYRFAQTVQRLSFDPAHRYRPTGELVHEAIEDFLTRRADHGQA